MSMLISNPLGFAADCIHSGDYTGAEQACRQILDRDPAVGDAWFVLGVASQLLGKVAPVGDLLPQLGAAGTWQPGGLEQPRSIALGGPSAR